MRCLDNTLVRGVYFLADDSVYELVIAFLNSLRSFNPLLQLCLVPYSSRCERIKNLADPYRFIIFEPNPLLQRFDELSLRFHTEPRGEYRKLALWSGPFDEFIYVDVDTVILGSFDRSFSYLTGADIIFGHSDIPGTQRWIWRNSEELPFTTTERGFAAGTGFFVSRKGALDWPLIDDATRFGIQHRDALELHAKEQAFLNVLVLISGLRYTSFVRLRRGGDASAPHECWAGDPRWKASDDLVCSYDDNAMNVLFIHWAGLGRLLSTRSLESVGMSAVWLRFRHSPMPDVFYTAIGAGFLSSGKMSVQ